jgi:hypothetical protein
MERFPQSYACTAEHNTTSPEELKDYPLQFAAGVDVGEIVRFVIGLLNSTKD